MAVAVLLAATVCEQREKGKLHAQGELSVACECGERFCI